MSVDGDLVGGERIGPGSLYLIRVPVTSADAPSSLLTMARALESHAAVQRAMLVWLDTPVAQYRLPQDGPDFTQWRVRPGEADGLNWALEDIAAPMAWGCEIGSPSVPVAIVDRGNRSVADVQPNYGAVQQFDTTLPEHGSLVSSVIAARANNNAGIAGVMWNAALSVYHADTPDPNITNPAILPVMAIYRAGIAGHRVINVSMGFDWMAQFNGPPNYSNPLDSARVVNLRDQLRYVIDLWRAPFQDLHPLLVIAASNNGQHNAFWGGWPAIADSAEYADEVIVVTASGRRAPTFAPAPTWASLGPLVDVAAPGVEVRMLTGGNAVTSNSGTSFAAPHVTGIAGLLFSFDPSLSASQVRALIIEGAVAGGRGLSGTYGGQPYTIHGVNAHESLKAAAARASAPLCGNRVWTENGNIVIERVPASGGAAGTTETLVPATPAAGAIETYHGGKWLEVPQAVGFDWNAFQWQGGAWHHAQSGGMTADETLGGSYLSLRRSNHERNIFVGANIVSGDQMRSATWEIYLTNRGVPGQRLVTSLSATGSVSGSSVCIHEEKPVDEWKCVGETETDPGQWYRINGSSDRLWSSVSFSALGDKIYFAINRSTTQESVGALSPCPWDNPDTPEVTRMCRPYSTRTAPAGYTLYSIDTATTVATVLAQEAGRAVYWMAPSELGHELVVGRGTPTTETEYTPDSAFTFDSLSLIGDEGWWKSETTETANCEVAFLRTSDGNAARPAVASELACKVSVDGTGTIAPIVNAVPAAGSRKPAAGSVDVRSRPRVFRWAPEGR